MRGQGGGVLKVGLEREEQAKGWLDSTHSCELSHTSQHMKDVEGDSPELLL